MATHKEIHSTEKLLDVIRNDTNAAFDSPEGAQPIPAGSSKSVVRSIPGQKKVTIGVDIGHTYIKLAKVIRHSDKSYELVDYQSITPDWSFTLDDPKFLDLLKSSLYQFCGEDRRCDIWSAIPSAKVEIRCLRIPKLPRKQVANAIFWTFTKTVDFNDAEELLDYEVLGEISEQGIKKVEVLTYKVPKKEVAALKDTFEEIGYPLKGISIAPFAIQNLLRTHIIEQSESDICSLFVGRDWSRIIIFSDGNLVLSRGVRAGMQSMVEAIEQATGDESEWSASSNELNTDGKQIKSDSAPQSIEAKQILFKFIAASKQTGDDGKASNTLQPQTVFQMLQPAIERLIRQVERTFEHFVSTFHREGVRRIMLSGQITANTGLVQYIGRQLDLPITVLNPFGPDSGFSQNVKIPDSRVERESYAPAIGLALSSNTVTPNVLYTHREKDSADALRHFNMRILTGCMICLMVLIFIFSWQGRRLDNKRNQVESLNQKLSEYQPPAEQELVTALFSKVQNTQGLLNQTVQRYRSVAVINELARITPVTIRLLSLEAVFSQRSGSASSNAASTVIVEGLIFGDGEGFETSLTSYLLSLKNSPVFSKPNIQSRQVEYYNQQQVLRFKARLEII